jgi:hypothetical protein
VSIKDKLEIGITPDAAYRKDNLPDFQQDDPAASDAAEPVPSEDSPRARAARDQLDAGGAKTGSASRALRRRQTRRKAKAADAGGKDRP